eukprot:CAMPEP_0201904006 /NCGR_PEP_ID=MMETSP0902-20130614/55772_1 /ASSEMBLY_ACC=CAM_ASM_000551 /TAXON_ID=420261 /ORGANISM="Thalassiosira antarctica, Strain CCMP982" /LENGTH=152 /DNA_ID=CAMNT_0048438075 /DNA_START=625 /DNA_END=1080 /DNA_ORIENTATION=+
MGSSVGLSVGELVGSSFKSSVSRLVGLSVGLSLGRSVGLSVGTSVGRLVCPFVGLSVGFFVGPSDSSSTTVAFEGNLSVSGVLTVMSVVVVVVDTAMVLVTGFFVELLELLEFFFEPFGDFVDLPFLGVLPVEVEVRSARSSSHCNLLDFDD